MSPACQQHSCLALSLPASLPGFGTGLGVSCTCEVQCKQLKEGVQTTPVQSAHCYYPLQCSLIQNCNFGSLFSFPPRGEEKAAGTAELTFGHGVYCNTKKCHSALPLTNGSKQRNQNGYTAQEWHGDLQHSTGRAVVQQREGLCSTPDELSSPPAARSCSHTACKWFLFGLCSLQSLVWCRQERKKNTKEITAKKTGDSKTRYYPQNHRRNRNIEPSCPLATARP